MTYCGVSALAMYLFAEFQLLHLFIVHQLGAMSHGARERPKDERENLLSLLMRVAV